MSDAPPTPCEETATVYGPCGGTYVAPEDVACASCSDIDPNQSEDVLLWAAMLAHASRRLYVSTDGRFTGCCETKIRPCRRRCDATLARRLALEPNAWQAFWPAFPMMVQAVPEPLFVNCWACSCGRDECSCHRLETIRLPWVPVRYVAEVKIDGVVLDPSAYKLLPGSNVLARIDGERWPSCQDQGKPDTEVGTWSVTEGHGTDLPPEAKDLVAGFACQLVKRCRGGACDLPADVRVESRPGVQYVVVDPLSYRKEGLTGYAPLDDWIMAIRGGHSRFRPRMWTPFDRPTAMRGW